jgi:predicted nucleotidyltransferase
VPKESSSSVVVKSADRNAIEQAVDTYLGELFARHPEVVRVIWFGSWVTGIPHPGSDVDLCPVLDRAEGPPRQRVPVFLPNGFPVGIDLFPYTEEELEVIRRERPGWYRCLTTGREVTRRQWISGRRRGRKPREQS